MGLSFTAARLGDPASRAEQNREGILVLQMGAGRGEGLGGGSSRFQLRGQAWEGGRRRLGGWSRAAITQPLPQTLLAWLGNEAVEPWCRAGSGLCRARLGH